MPGGALRTGGGGAGVGGSAARCSSRARSRGISRQRCAAGQAGTSSTVSRISACLVEEALVEEEAGLVALLGDGAALLRSGSGARAAAWPGWAVRAAGRGAARAAPGTAYWAAVTVGPAGIRAEGVEGDLLLGREVDRALHTGVVGPQGAVDVADLGDLGHLGAGRPPGREPRRRTPPQTSGAGRHQHLSRVTVGRRPPWVRPPVPRRRPPCRPRPASPRPSDVGEQLAPRSPAVALCRPRSSVPESWASSATIISSSARWPGSRPASCTAPGQHRDGAPPGRPAPPGGRGPAASMVSR